MRLGHREGLIVLSQPDPPVVPVLWSVVEPCPFPWLNRDHHLCFQNAAEHEMITTLFTVLELRHCSSVSKAQWEKLARQLSQAFWVFYSQCQVLGEVKQGFPWLAQARLGLMLIAQSSSYFLLQEKLGICAPLEL
ncbi:MAG: hypothetical protein HC920_18475 [Oscillatoriales cyanobacterium SM2_3_0]|nr:hypothetical protein [Oscillatoriales cyanobacterium SM2_3_0]